MLHRLTVHCSLHAISGTGNRPLKELVERRTQFYGTQTQINNDVLKKKNYLFVLSKICIHRKFSLIINTTKINVLR
jgi:hypothetical protein